MLRWRDLTFLALTLGAACAHPRPDDAPARAIYRPHPPYPLQLEERSVEGYVVVGYGIDATGATRNIRVLETEPGEAFVEGVLRTVERWRFEPKRFAGRDVESHETATFLFCLPEAMRFGVSRIEACRGSGRGRSFREAMWRRYRHYPFREWRPTDEPFELEGRWRAIDSGLACDENHMILERSGDGGMITARMLRPIDHPKAVDEIRYRVLEESPGRVHLQDLAETERDPAGEIASWEILALEPDAHCWRRTDWLPESCVLYAQRCSP